MQSFPRLKYLLRAQSRILHVMQPEMAEYIIHKVRTIFGSIHLFLLFHVVTAVRIFHQRMSLAGVAPVFSLLDPPRPDKTQ